MSFEQIISASLRGNDIYAFIISFRSVCSFESLKIAVHF